MKIVTAGEILEIKTGKYDANHAKLGGKYRFFTCAMESTMADTYAFDDEVLILPGNGANVGEVFYYKGKLEAYQRTYILHKITQNTRYLYYYFKKNWIRQITKRQVGSATNYIKMDDIVSFEIPLPPLPQQQKIANILDAADALRQNDKALIAKYDELTQALFLDMFGDPVSNPKGWEKKEFKEYILDVKNGITRRPKTEQDNSGDKILKLKHIRSNFINYDCENRILLEESEKQKFDVKIGDLLFIRVNGNPDYVGRCALHNNIDEVVYFNDHIMRVRYNLNLYVGVFLSQYLNYSYGQSEIAKQIKTSAGQHTINQGGLEKLNLIIPPIELQNQFAERVTLIEEQKAIAQKSLEKSESLFNSLLQKAFKGELA
jgi:type I restriction enzyme S subunit